ncbi:Holliday junction ATP-dependent DNA helicase RuvB [Polystyrenella longa]|uniref:Holliday junction ATP-dependent DNA helicase RuvB n=1 Tax=Polystyrenella longa TaxID=2528007 RepID=A0A518CM97_9PLAN|nr:Holliday junction ATP-dependent DNA helicase RuvB [Polystyrenella longa]
MLESLEAELGKILLGKPEPIRLVLIAMLSEGHVLLEDVPGVGKTSLAKGVAKIFDCDFKRLQFTPDMLPSDILGSSVFLSNTSEFEFRKGPIFTNVLLADEINRTTPRTQSALLEAMEEHQVSAEGVTYKLEKPFFVIATQNPFESEGTYPLPENQLDRFIICTEIGYPQREVEKNVLKSHRAGSLLDADLQSISTDSLLEMQRQVREVQVDDSIYDYLLDIVEATRNHEQLRMGVSTRAALTFYRAAQSLAFMEGRDYVIPDDIKQLAIPVLAHRVVCRGFVREGQRDKAKEVIRQILESTSTPA